MAKIEITKGYLEEVLGLDPQAVKVVASRGGMSLEGKCNRPNCNNCEKVVDIGPDGIIETLRCEGFKDDCLG